jgi:hypothetical protein
MYGMHPPPHPGVYAPEDVPIPGVSFHDQMRVIRPPPERRLGPMDAGWDGVIPPPPPITPVKTAPAVKAKPKADPKAIMAKLVAETSATDIAAAIDALKVLKVGGPPPAAAVPPATAVPAGTIAVSLSDSDGEAGKGEGGGGGEGKTAQTKKRARRALRAAKEKAFIDAKVPKGPGIFTAMVEGVAADIDMIGGILAAATSTGGPAATSTGGASSSGPAATSTGGRSSSGPAATSTGGASSSGGPAEGSGGAGGSGGGGSTDGDPTGDGGGATSTRTRAERGRAASNPGGSAGGGGGGGSGGGSNGGGEEESKGKKYTYFCRECQDSIPLRSKLLLDDGGLYGCSAEWQDAIWDVCEPCSGMSPEQFKKQRKKAWADRAVALGGRLNRYRSLTFNNLGAQIQAGLPGAKYSLIRELSFLRLKCCCLSLAVSLNKENKPTLDARDMVQSRYEARLEAAVADPDNRCTMDGQVFKAQELQNLTVITEGFSVSFVCRRTECLWFGMNHEWPKDRYSDHWACPICSYKYVPWEKKASRQNFQFVLAMPDAINGGRLYLPALWADKQDETWLREQMEVHALNLQNSDELEAYTLGQATKSLMDYVHTVSNPTDFKYEPWVKPKGIEDKYDLSLYEARGTSFGMKLTMERDGANMATPFCEWPHLAALMGRLVLPKPGRGVMPCSGQLSTCRSSARVPPPS